MKHTRPIALVFVCFAALLASSPAGAADIHPAVLAAAQTGTLTRVLVILKAQADLSGARAIQNRKGKGAHVFAKLRAAAGQTQGSVLARIQSMDLAAKPFFIMNAIYVEARPGRWITPQQLEALSADPGVAKIRTAEVQADRPVEKTSLTAQAAASYSGPQPNIVQIGAPTVWAKGYTGQGVVIGVIDTGEDATFPDIATKYRGYVGAGLPTSDNYNFFDASDTPCPNPLTGNPMPCDTDGHGTFVTGIADGSNPAFQIGVAPDAQWIGCRAITADATVSTILTCLQWMLAPTDVLGNNPDPTKAPDIVNNSYFCQGCGIDSAFTSLRSAGIVPVAAIGNYGPYCLSADEPGGYPDVVGVGAVFSNGTITDFSSRGPYLDINDNLWAKPDVTAPGAAIVSALANTTTYTEESGTSFSSPHVAGEIALLLSANPSLDFLSVSGTTPQPADVSLLIGAVSGGADATLNSACDPAFTGIAFGPTGNVYGAGTINVPNTLQILLGAHPLLVTSTDPAELPANVPLSIPVGATGGTPAYRWALTSPGTLPAGLTFNAGVGVLSGTPSLGESSFLQFQVTDSAQGSGMAFINLSVLGFTATALPAGTVGTAYFTTPAAAGGSSNYFFQFSCLPPGLSDDGMGDITGIPTQAGTYSVCATVSDNATSATQNLTLTIVAAAQTSQTITFGALASHAFGAPPFTVSATASSGLTVSFASTTMAVCTVSGTTVTLVAAGMCNIQATQSGNANYAAATPVNRSFQITPPTPAAVTATAGAVQTTSVGTPFPTALKATATDAFGNPMSGVTVYFSAPTSGATAILSAPSAITNSAGVASIGATANNSAGSYSVTASVTGVPATATFSLTNTAAAVTVQTSPAGLPFSVDGVIYTSAKSFAFALGSAHTISVNPTIGGNSTQQVFTAWSDGLAASHSITASAAPTVFTATFQTQYQLTTNSSPATYGSVTPGTGFFNAGSTVPVLAVTAGGSIFRSWTGPVASSTSSGTSVVMTGPIGVTANFGNPPPTLSPELVTMQYYQGTDPSTLAVQVSVNVDFAERYTVSFANPLPNTIALSSISGIAPGTLTVTPSVKPNLAPGLYVNQLVFQFSDGTALTQYIDVYVYPLPTFSAQPATSLSFTAQAGAAAVQSKQQTLAANTRNFSFTMGVTYDRTSIPPWLSLSVSSGTTPSTFSVTVNPTGLATGVYHANIVATSASASNSPFSIPVTFTITPGITLSQVTNAASGAVGAAAPNTILSAFGVFPGCSSAQVTVNGAAASVFYSSPGQINFLMPGSVAGFTSASVQIACAGLTSQPISVSMAATSPGLFTASQNGKGQAAIVNQDGTLSTSTPAGTYIQVYGTGFGSYAAPGSDGLRRLTSTVSASLGGLPVTVLYAGDAPGFTDGLQQIDLMIPAGAALGQQALVLTAGNAQTQTSVILSILAKSLAGGGL